MNEPNPFQPGASKRLNRLNCLFRITVVHLYIYEGLLKPFILVEVMEDVSPAGEEWMVGVILSLVDI